MKTFAKILTGILLFAAAVNFAQEKSTVKEKLNKLSGKVEKISIVVDGKETTFTGDEAKKIMEMIQSDKEENFRVWVSDGDDIDEMDDCESLYFVDEGGEVSMSDAIDLMKKINIEDKDGKKIVTVETTKDGKTETKIYEGEDAEKFLKEAEKDKEAIEWISVCKNGDNVKLGECKKMMENGKKCKLIKVKLDGDAKKKMKKVIIKKEKKEDNN